MYFLFFFFSGGESGRNSILLLSQLRTCINETHTWACQKRWEIRGGEKRSDPRGEKKKIDLCVSQICLKGKRRTKLQFSRKEGRKGALPTFNGVLRKLAQRRREFYRIFGAISGKKEEEENNHEGAFLVFPEFIWESPVCCPFFFLSRL